MCLLTFASNHVCVTRNKNKIPDKEFMCVISQVIWPLPGRGKGEGENVDNSDPKAVFQFLQEN